MKAGDKMAAGLFQEKYQIIKILPVQGEIKYYVGRSNFRQDEGLVLINEISRRKWINAHLGEILSKAQDKKIPGFIECFAEKEKLYIVFIYHRGMVLPDWLKKYPLNFNDRILLSCRILEEFSDYQHCPLVLQKAIIQCENIVVGDNTLAFNYQLTTDEKIIGVTVFRNMENLLRTIFSEQELVQKSGIRIVLEKCRKNLYLSVGELIRDLIAAKHDTPRWLCLWEKIKAQKPVMQRYLTPLFFAGLGLGAAFYAWGLWTAGDKAVDGPVLTQIGSVEVAARREKAKENAIVNVHDFPLPQALPVSLQAAEEFGGKYKYPICWGDTLIDISLKHYGSASYVPKLAEYNHIPDQDLIYEGDTLDLPDQRSLAGAP